MQMQFGTTLACFMLAGLVCWNAAASPNAFAVLHRTEIGWLSDNLVLAVVLALFQHSVHARVAESYCN